MRIYAGLFVALLLSSVFATASMAQEPPPRSVTVSATDTVRVAPDRVIVRFAVVTRAQLPEGARQENEEVSQRVLNSVRNLNIPDRQIQVRTLRINEEVEYRQGRRVRIGFIARREVEVIIDDMDRLPALVASVVQEGATEFGGIVYDIRDRRAQEDEALRRAALRAREKADVLATALGTSVRMVHSIAEAGVSIPGPYYPQGRAVMEMAMDGGGEPEAYSPGEIEVRATVNVVFELQ